MSDRPISDLRRRLIGDMTIRTFSDKTQRDTILADFKTFYPNLVAASPTAASFRDEVAT
jgi:hypothetical protein